MHTSLITMKALPLLGVLSALALSGCDGNKEHTDSGPHVTPPATPDVSSTPAAPAQPTPHNPAEPTVNTNTEANSKATPDTHSTPKPHL